MKLKYLFQFWKLVNLLIIAFSIASFAISFNFYYNQQKSLDMISQSQGYSYINFQGLIISSYLLISFLALTCFFSSIKFINLFRFNQKVLFFSKVLEAIVDKIYPIMNERTRTFVVEAHFINPPKKLFPNFDLLLLIYKVQYANTLKIVYSQIHSFLCPNVKSSVAEPEPVEPNLSEIIFETNIYCQCGGC